MENTRLRIPVLELKHQAGMEPPREVVAIAIRVAAAVVGVEPMATPTEAPTGVRMAALMAAPTEVRMGVRTVVRTAAPTAVQMGARTEAQMVARSAARPVEAIQGLTVVPTAALIRGPIRVQPAARMVV